MKNLTLKDIMIREIEIKTHYYENIKENNKDEKYFYKGILYACADIYKDINKLTEKQFIQKYDSIEMILSTDYFYITKCNKYETEILDGYDFTINHILNMVCPLLTSNYRHEVCKKYELIIPENYGFYNYTLMKKLNLNNKSEGYFVINNNDDEDFFVFFTDDVKEKYDKAFDYFMENIYSELIKQIKPEDRNIFEDDKNLIN